MDIMRQIKLLLANTSKIEGDYLDTRIFQGELFQHLVVSARQMDRMAYGLETFTGIAAPTPKDLNESYCYPTYEGMYGTIVDFTTNKLDKLKTSNYKIISGKFQDTLGKLPADLLLSFSILDLFNYKETMDGLEYLYEHTNYSGVILLNNYDDNKEYGSALAVSDFLEKYDKTTILHNLPLINDSKQNFALLRIYNPKYAPLTKETDEKVSIAMVLRTGGPTYNADYVNALANAIKRNVTIAHEVVCLTDDSTGFNKNVDRVVELKHDYPGWWSKIELFRPDIFPGKVFFLDLDTVITGNIDKILMLDFDFIALSDFYTMTTLGSGLMAWNPKVMNHVYSNFVPRSREIMNNYRFGDQEWIDEQKPSVQYFQDVFHNAIVSYKKHCLRNGKITIKPENRIVCFHGHPRPHIIIDPLIKNHWIP